MSQISPVPFPGVINGLTFEQMVKDLFKITPGIFGAGIHAAIGICGEVAEIADACSIGDLVEECGDAEFYVEALWWQLEVVTSKTRKEICETLMPWDGAVFHFGTILNELVTCSGGILDVAKKAWVYEGIIRVNEIASGLLRFECAMGSLYSCLGLERSAVKHANMMKLISKTGRYASGKYSNEAALARADKNGGAS